MTYKINLQLIKQQRERYHYTMQEMADFLGLKTRADYFKRENGDTRFAAAEMPILSKTLHMPIGRFFTQGVDKIETKKKEL